MRYKLWGSLLSHYSPEKPGERPLEGHPQGPSCILVLPLYASVQDANAISQSNKHQISRFRLGMGLIACLSEPLALTCTYPLFWTDHHCQVATAQHTAVLQPLLMASMLMLLLLQYFVYDSGRAASPAAAWHTCCHGGDPW